MEERDRRRFDLADEDKDGSLTRDEFTNFLHPEEAEHMRDVVVQETLEVTVTFLNKFGKKWNCTFF